MNKSDRKVLRVIKYNENYIKNHYCEDIKNPNWFIKYIELPKYKEMLGKDKRKLPDYLKELYQAI